MTSTATEVVLRCLRQAQHARVRMQVCWRLIGSDEAEHVDGWLWPESPLYWCNPVDEVTNVLITKAKSSLRTR